MEQFPVPIGIGQADRFATIESGSVSLWTTYLFATIGRERSGQQPRRARFSRERKRAGRRILGYPKDYLAYLIFLITDLSDFIYGYSKKILYSVNPLVKKLFSMH